MSSVLAAAKVVRAIDPPAWQHLDLAVNDDISLSDLRCQAKSKGYSLPAEKNSSYLDDNGINYHQRTLIKNHQQEEASWNMMCLMDLAWAHQHVSPMATDMRFTFSIPGRQSLGPHTDRSRRWVMIYVLNGGGPDHRTVFYREKGIKSLVRSTHMVIDDYDQVEEVGYITIPDRTWILLNAEIIHSIENIQAIRKTIQISFPCFPDDLRLSNHLYLD